MYIFLRRIFYFGYLIDVRIITRIMRLLFVKQTLNTVLFFKANVLRMWHNFLCSKYWILNDNNYNKTYNLHVVWYEEQ